MNFEKMAAEAAEQEKEPFELSAPENGEPRDLSPFEQEGLLNDMEQYVQGLMENLREKNEVYAELRRGTKVFPEAIARWEADIQELADEISSLQTEIAASRKENPVMTIQTLGEKELGIEGQIKILNGLMENYSKERDSEKPDPEALQVLEKTIAETKETIAALQEKEKQK